MNRKTTASVVLTLLLGGCASDPGERPELKTYFVTDIDQQGSKRFNYSVVASRAQKDGKKGKDGRGMGRSKGQGGRGGQGQKRGEGRKSANQGDVTAKLKTQVTENLELRLADNRYCREGYIELDSYFSRVRSYIRGECKEAATDEDRQAFANNRLGHSDTKSIK
jgi:hypothetical protein